MLENALRINIRRLLEFFDKKVDESEGHATAIVSVCGEDLGCGLLKHYFESRGASVEVLPGPCTTGDLRGPRLDKWIRVTGSSELNDPDVLFQVEIKNWSAHALDGKVLEIEATPEKIACYKKDRWRKEWEDGVGIKKPSLKKLLTPISPPAKFVNIRAKPLACLWTAIHPDGETDSLFSVPLPESYRGYFDRVWFFSMSSYLRSRLPKKYIRLQMPDTMRRVSWLHELFGQ